MKCFHHPEVDAAQECRACGHPVCGECVVEVQGSPYCKTCLEARLQAPPSPPPSGTGPDFKSPKAAGWLALVPGLGLVYLGQYLKALVVWLLFFGAIQVADHSDIGGMLIPFVWLAQLFYSVQEARRMNRLKAGGELVEEPEIGQDESSPIWGWILVGIGSLFLLDQFDMISFGVIFEKFWPLLIIALGIQILLRGRLKKVSTSDS